MGSLQFRPLKASEVECRINQVKQNYITLLLYKNARVDMEILDETVSSVRWQREHYDCKGKDYCKVSINVGDIKNPVWVSKSECGAESAMEKEKGESSDSFKRACVNWGIGRELYTSPHIRVTDCCIEPTNRKDKYGNTVLTCRDTFKVSDLVVEDKKIVALAISRYDYASRKWVNVFNYDTRNVQR